GPGPPPIAGMENPGRFRPARAEPDVLLAVRNQAGPAGGEGSLIWQGPGQARDGKPGPLFAPVVGDDQEKSPLDGIAQGDAVFFVPEGQGVEEGGGLGVPELQGPGFAAVRGFVDARSVAGPGTQQVGSALSKGLDVAEIEFCRAGY